MLSAILTLFLLGLVSIRKVALWQVVQKKKTQQNTSCSSENIKVQISQDFDTGHDTTTGL